MMDSKTPQAVNGAGDGAVTPRYRLREPKLAKRVPGVVGVVQKCRGCGKDVVSIGRGRPKDWCPPCKEAERTRFNADYYRRNVEKIAARVKAKRAEVRKLSERLAEAAKGGESGQPECSVE